ncbi:MAG: hypothetical protein QXS19_06855 [Candidatus Methanomethylicia archaeon]
MKLVFSKNLHKFALLDENDNLIVPTENDIYIKRNFNDKLEEIANVEDIVIKSNVSANVEYKKINKIGSEFYGLIYNRDGYINYIGPIQNYNERYLIANDRAYSKTLEQFGVITLNKIQPEGKQSVVISNNKFSFKFSGYAIEGKLNNFKLASIIEKINFIPLIEKSASEEYDFYDVIEKAEDYEVKIKFLDNKKVTLNIKAKLAADEDELEEEEGETELKSNREISANVGGILDHNISTAKTIYELELTPHPTNPNGYILRFTSLSPSGVVKNQKEVELRNDSHARLIIARYLSAKRPVSRKLFELLKQQGKIRLQAEQEVSNKLFLAKVGNETIILKTKPFKRVKLANEKGLFIYVNDTDFYFIDEDQINVYKLSPIKKYATIEKSDIEKIINGLDVEQALFVTDKYFVKIAGDKVISIPKIPRVIYNGIIVFNDKLDVIKFNKVAYSLSGNTEKIIQSFNDDYISSILKGRLSKYGFAILEKHELRKTAHKPVGKMWLEISDDAYRDKILNIDIQGNITKVDYENKQKVKEILNKLGKIFNWDEEYINSKIASVELGNRETLYILKDNEPKHSKILFFDKHPVFSIKIATQDQLLTQDLINTKDIRVELEENFFKFITFVTSHLLPFSKDTEISEADGRAIFSQYGINVPKGYRFFSAGYIPQYFLFDSLHITLACGEKVIEKQIYLKDKKSLQIIIAIKSEYDITDKKGLQKLIEDLEKESQLELNIKGYIDVENYGSDSIASLIQALSASFDEVNYNFVNKVIEVNSHIVIDKDNLIIRGQGEEFEKVSSEFFVSVSAAYIGREKFSFSGILPKVAYDLLPISNINIKESEYKEEEITLSREKGGLLIETSRFIKFIPFSKIASSSDLLSLYNKINSNKMKVKALVEHNGHSVIVNEFDLTNQLEKIALEYPVKNSIVNAEVIEPHEISLAPVIAEIVTPFAANIPIEELVPLLEQDPSSVVRLTSIQFPYQHYDEVQDVVADAAQQGSDFAEDLKQEQAMELQVTSSILKLMGQPIVNINQFLYERAMESNYEDFNDPLSMRSTREQKDSALEKPPVKEYEDRLLNLAEQKSVVNIGYPLVSQTPFESAGEQVDTSETESEKTESKKDNNKKTNKKKSHEIIKAYNPLIKISFDRNTKIVTIDKTKSDVLIRELNSGRLIVANTWEEANVISSSTYNLKLASLSDTNYSINVSFNKNILQVNGNTLNKSGIDIVNGFILIKQPNVIGIIKVSSDETPKPISLISIRKNNVVDKRKENVKYSYLIEELSEEEIKINKIAKIGNKQYKVGTFIVNQNKYNVKRADDIIPEEFADISSPQAISYAIQKISEVDPELAEVLEQALVDTSNMVNYIDVLEEARNILGILLIKANIEALPINKLAIKNAFNTISGIVDSLKTLVSN